MKKIRNLLLFILLLVMVPGFSAFTCGESLAEKNKLSPVNAGGACVMEVNTGRILYSCKSDSKLPMASTTKVMTALIALENTELDEEFIVDARAVGVEGSSIYLKKGETVKMQDLLYGLMLMSGNDAAEAIAYKVAGSLENFAGLMNEKAKELGAANTNFVNPHGLHDENHYTTAADLCKIASEALKNPQFKKIVSTKKYTMEGIDNGTIKGETRYFSNKNKMLTQYEGANGVKTGYTKAAGRCLVTSAERDGMQIVSVVLNCPEMWKVSAEIMDYAFSEYKYTEVVKAYNYYADIPVEKGKNQTVKVCSIEPVYYPLKEDEHYSVKLEVNIADKFSAPVYKNYKAGEVKVYFDGECIAERDIITIDESMKKTLLDKIKDFFDRLF